MRFAAEPWRARRAGIDCGSKVAWKASPQRAATLPRRQSGVWTYPALDSFRPAQHSKGAGATFQFARLGGKAMAQGEANDMRKLGFEPSHPSVSPCDGRHSSVRALNARHSRRLRAHTYAKVEAIVKNQAPDVITGVWSRAGEPVRAPSTSVSPLQPRVELRRCRPSMAMNPSTSEEQKATSDQNIPSRIPIWKWYHFGKSSKLQL